MATPKITVNTKNQEAKINFGKEYYVISTGIVDKTILLRLIKDSKGFTPVLKNNSNVKELPSMETITFQEKAINCTLKAMAYNFICCGCSVDDFLKLEKLLLKGVSKIELTEYMLISDVIKHQINDILGYIKQLNKAIEINRKIAS